MGALLLLWNRRPQGLGLLGICVIPHPRHLLGRGQHPNIPWPVALGFKSKGFQKRDLVAHLGSGAHL